MDVASSIQIVLEEIILKICRYLKETYKRKYLFSWRCCIKLCSKWQASIAKTFKNIWIQPAAGDAGGALGAALYLWYNISSEKNNNLKNQQRIK